MAHALAGRAGIDITRHPIAPGVTLRDLWPSAAEIEATLAAALDPADVAPAYAEAEASGPWAALEAPDSARFPWDTASTYLRPPPFVTMATPPVGPGFVADPLLVLGDDITTDQSPLPVRSRRAPTRPLGSSGAARIRATSTSMPRAVATGR